MHKCVPADTHPKLLNLYERAAHGKSKTINRQRVYRIDEKEEERNDHSQMNNKTRSIGCIKKSSIIEEKIIIENQKIRRGKMQNRNHQKYYLKNKFNIQEKKKN